MVARLTLFPLYQPTSSWPWVPSGTHTCVRVCQRLPS